MRLLARSAVKQTSIEAVVLGPCRYCGMGAQFWPEHPDCEHEPTFRRDLGVVSRWHRNPLVRLGWWAQDLWRK